ncbi:MAG: phosphonate ABC transporter ATP-binding protein [Limnochordia bacterium]|jgi:phosphonate transport system ATP-binding protein|nr:phosphonate ABC transporter ATP-binding protein [Bacillota bacterium]
MLEIRKLTKKYTAGPQALKGVDLSIKEGEIVALIGPSGAGKSTLIRCINRLVEPTSGEILFHGVDVCKLGARALRETRKKIGMIFQEYALVDRLSVMENVLSGRLGSVGFWASARRKFPQEDVEEALFLLERVGLADYVDTRADQLSGGQRQRVGICRALLQRPDLLLIDEPTASLDPKTGRQIMRLITELVRERNLAAIINIHEVGFAEMFTQRVVGLKDGLIVYDQPAGKLDADSLTLIYGEEDWTSLTSGADADDDSEEVS